MPWAPQAGELIISRMCPHNAIAVAVYCSRDVTSCLSDSFPPSLLVLLYTSSQCNLCSPATTPPPPLQPLCRKNKPSCRQRRGKTQSHCRVLHLKTLFEQKMTEKLEQQPLVWEMGNSECCARQMEKQQVPRCDGTSTRIMSVPEWCRLTGRGINVSASILSIH